MASRKIFHVIVCFAVIFAAMFLRGRPAEARRKADAAREQKWEERSDGVRLVEGHIEDVTSNAIRVRGRYYDFTGVPILNERGQASSQSQLVRGREIKLFFKNRVLSRIMVFENMVIQ